MSEIEIPYDVTFTVAPIALEHLKVSEKNVRQHPDKKSIEALARNIGAIGLLNPLTVIKGKVNGDYEVIAGQRRLAALQHLYDGDLSVEVPCRIYEDADKAATASLAENEMRQDISPYDVYDAIAGLVSNHSADELASIFGMTKKEILQLCALGKLDIKLLHEARKIDMTIEALAHFTRIPGHKEQRAIFTELQKRRALAAWNVRTAVDNALGDKVINISRAIFDPSLVEEHLIRNLFDDRDVQVPSDIFKQHQDAAVEAMRQRIIETGATLLEKNPQIYNPQDRKHLTPEAKAEIASLEAAFKKAWPKGDDTDDEQWGEYREASEDLDDAIDKIYRTIGSYKPASLKKATFWLDYNPKDLTVDMGGPIFKEVEPTDRTTTSTPAERKKAAAKKATEDGRIDVNALPMPTVAKLADIKTSILSLAVLDGKTDELLPFMVASIMTDRGNVSVRGKRDLDHPAGTTIHKVRDEAIKKAAPKATIKRTTSYAEVRKIKRADLEKFLILALLDGLHYGPTLGAQPLVKDVWAAINVNPRKYWKPDMAFFQMFTTSQLTALYKNLTGMGLPGKGKDAMAANLANLFTVAFTGQIKEYRTRIGSTESDDAIKKRIAVINEWMPDGF